jgi:hypothetical protein
MTVYVDRASNRFGRMIMAHMVADTLDELHAMADRLGLKREWFQADASTPHYDISKTKRALALKFGVVEVNRRQMAEIIKRLRQERIEASLSQVDRAAVDAIRAKPPA